MGKLIPNPLSVERKKQDDMNQEQMAALLKTSQSEISKTESGELPPESEIPRWARAYKLSVKRFRALCEAARWVLPLWKTAYRTPSEIEVIDCTTKKANLA